MTRWSGRTKESGGGSEAGMVEKQPSFGLVRILIAALVGLLSSMLGAYFIWLGTEVNTIGKDVARIDAAVGLLVDRRRENDEEGRGK